MTSTAVQTTADQDRRDAIRSLTDLARKAMTASGGNIAEAAAAMNEALRDDEGLRTSLIEAALEALNFNAAYKLMRSERTAMLDEVARPTPNWTPGAAKGATSRSKTSVAALVPGITRTLLDFPLAGGLKLRDARLEDVARQASIYMTQGNEMLRRGRWMAAISAALPDHEATVGECLSAEDLERIQKEASDV